MNPETGNLQLDSLTLDELLADDMLRTSKLSNLWRKRVAALSYEKSFQRTAELISSREMRRSYKDLARLRSQTAGLPIIAESAERDKGEMHKNDLPPEIVDRQNVADIAGETIKDVSAGEMQPSIENGLDIKFSLGEFLRRPTYLTNITFAELGANNWNFFNPWELWSNDPSIRAKLNNFAYFRGDLHVQFTVSGTPYAYGKLMAGFIPYADYNDLWQGYRTVYANGNATDGYNWGPCMMSYVSQQEGSLVLDVNENEPVVMKIPFLSYKQQFKLFNSATTVIANSDPLEDFSDAGEIAFGPIRPYRTSDDNQETQITCTIFAWVENAQLGNPTGTDFDITAQARPRRRKSKNKRAGSLKAVMYQAKGLVDAAIPDEYEADGPVSSVASAVSKSAAALKDVPIIGPFASATSAISGTVGKIASWFGFSKPVQLDPPIYVKNNPFANAATTASVETTYKISVDPKQELALDVSLGGTEGEDCMAITHIAKRESYLTTFKWDYLDEPMTDIIWRSMVTPKLFNIGAKVAGTNDSTNFVVQPTPMAFVSEPFQYWRGTLRYRFEFVVSRFHRGKVLIKFEPNIPQSALIATGTSRLNQQNTILVDLQETQEVEIDVDWATCKAWCKNDYTVSDNVSCFPITGGDQDLTDIVGVSYVSASIGGDAANGQIIIMPFTRLVQPNTAAFAMVNVYVSCPDLVVARPRSLVQRSRSYEYTAQSNESEDVRTLNPTGANTDHIYQHHFGEAIPSLRSMMKRYQTYFRTTTTVSSGNNEEIFFNVIGHTYDRPAVLYGQNVATYTGIQWTDLYNYLFYSFLGMRGGMRFRVLLMGGGLAAAHDYVKVYLQNNNVTDATSLATTAFSSSINLTDLSNNFSYDMEGQQTYCLASNGGVEFEIPFYSNNLFVIANNNSFGGDDTWLGALRYDATWSNDWQAYFSMRGITMDEAALVVDRATAEDFTFLRFTGASWYGIAATP